jgi:putative DNA primase/helicase
VNDLIGFEAQFDEQPDPLSDWLQALTEAENEDGLFALLAQQRPPKSKLARQHVRGRLVKILTKLFRSFDSGASPTKTADAWLAEGSDQDDDLQGREYVAEEIDPWPEQVDGAAVLHDVATTIETFVYSTRENLTVLVLWSAYSHCFDVFGISPILDISSPTKRCGKSTAVVVLRHLCAHPLLSGNITAAALFRSIEAWKPTLLIDEADTFLKMADELRGILNAGHTRDTAFTIRSEGDNNEPRVFSTWAPKVVAAIGRLPDTIEDRSVRILLARKPTSVTKADVFDPFTVREVCTPVRRRLARFALDNLDAIAGAEVSRPEGLNDRAWNNWRPLFMIASVAGGDWLDRAREAALALAGREDADDEDVGTLALRHIWEVLEPAERVSTHDILRQLVERDDAPWAKWWAAELGSEREKVAAAALSRRLKPFGISPKQLRIAGENVRGYEAEDFRNAVSQYLDLDATDATDATTRTSKQAKRSDRSDRSVKSEPPEEDVPGLGDDGFTQLLQERLRAGHITEREMVERLRLLEVVRAA